MSAKDAMLPSCTLFSYEGNIDEGDMTKYQRVIQDTEPDKTTLNNYDLWISTTT